MWTHLLEWGNLARGAQNRHIVPAAQSALEMWTAVNCCLVWHRMTDVEPWHGQVFLNTNLSHLRFCFQSPELSSVTSVHPLFLSNSPHGLISLNPAVFTVTSTLMVWLASSARLTHQHAALSLTNTVHEKCKGSCCLSLRAIIKFPIPGRMHPIFHPWRSGQSSYMNLISITLSDFILLVYTAEVYPWSFVLPSSICFHSDIPEHSINTTEITK